MSDEFGPSFFFFKQKTAYEIPLRLVGSENVYKRQVQERR